MFQRGIFTESFHAFFSLGFQQYPFSADHCDCAIEFRLTARANKIIFALKSGKISPFSAPPARWVRCRP
jgi:hypothetical protein